MSALGCTAPSACPDYGALNKYWSVAQAKAQGLEPVYPEGWLLDAKAALDLGKFGVKLLSGASSGATGSLEALGRLGRTDAGDVLSKTKVDLGTRVDDAQQYDKFRNATDTAWDWGKNAPNGGAVPGTTQTSVVEAGTTLDRYGSRRGEYMSPADTPFESRSLPPGKQAEPYEQYPVLKKFTVVKEDIAPAFDMSGGGVQLRAQIPEVQNGFANINDLIRFGYLKDPKGK